MKMTVTHAYLLQLADILARPELVFDGECIGSIAYKIFMNRKTALTYKEVFDQAFPADPELDKYSAERRSIAEEVNASLPDIAEGQDAPTEEQENARKQALFTEKVAALDEKYRGTLEKARAMQLEKNKTLAEKVEVDLYTLAPSDVKIKSTDPMYPNATQNAWLIWAILYNDGEGIIRENA